MKRLVGVLAAAAIGAISTFPVVDAHADPTPPKASGRVGLKAVGQRDKIVITGHRS